MEAVTQQAVGGKYVLESMKVARDKTWDVVDRMSRIVRPGMLESEANVECKKLLVELGMDRIWHPILIRFGENTLKTFKQRADVDPRLNDDDIFFIDLGVVWDAHEGDAGATFVVGNDADMQACATAAKTVFDDVEQHWRSTGAGGKALYDYAAERAAALGWKLNLDIKGHRVSDFPHAIFKAGDLGSFESCPDAGLWILEIQLAHPTRPFGAFYEDLLI
ncbi:M24 family metallopeptidase [Paraburkholderia sp.]|uniref:M24 family metallopeptidase n=1 Tax=Paraburkholderia sp. TaxID=1926495 RepID=UPI00239A4354|nr:M24 family metallopeptidase [Paraburkholderia sp.]MDE1184732.1 M24 family metallopeptidase [Paraburkholderia sp.]